MVFHIITIFPNIFSAKGGSASGGDSCGYFSQSIIKRAIEKKLINIKIHNLRDYTSDKHKTVDDTPYGGGAGMVLKVEPIYKCIKKIKLEIRKSSKARLFPSSSRALRIPQSRALRTILFSAKGKRYTQADAKRLCRYENIILICGRYEGVDERVEKYLADEEISIGEYILTGGEIPAMAVVDSITRLIPGTLGNAESPKDESFSSKNYLEYPQYTKPADFINWKVPKVLLGGNHKEINIWREKHSKLAIRSEKSKIQSSNVKSNPKK
jgi:tRNA (guanine37-N1)-methyltransferase